MHRVDRATRGLPHRGIAAATAVASVLLGALGAVTAGTVADRDRLAAAAGDSALGTWSDLPGGPVVSDTDPAAAAARPLPESPPIGALARSLVSLDEPTVVRARRGALPVGKGMWLWQPEKIEGGDVGAMIGRAKAVGLTHLYVRTGSSRMGFYAQPFLDQILPAAHAAGVRVYGWDFPYFTDVAADVARTVDAIRYTTPDGHRLDGFVPDVETIHEGVAMTPENAAAFGRDLRAAVGPDYPLIVAVPRPSTRNVHHYPFAQVVEHFDAIAPMVYWLNRQPDSDVIGAIEFLGQFGKPIIPIGQAYDGAPEGGRPGIPPPDELRRFMAAAEARGAVGVSFWSWQHADQATWDTIATDPHFVVPASVEGIRATQVVALQVLLSSLGYPAPLTGNLDEVTAQSLRTFQRDHGLAVTGVLDEATRALLLAPRASHLEP